MCKKSHSWQFIYSTFATVHFASEECDTEAFSSFWLILKTALPLLSNEDTFNVILNGFQVIWAYSHKQKLPAAWSGGGSPAATLISSWGSTEAAWAEGFEPCCLWARPPSLAVETKALHGRFLSRPLNRCYYQMRNLSGEDEARGNHCRRSLSWTRPAPYCCCLHSEHQ